MFEIAYLFLTLSGCALVACSTGLTLAAVGFPEKRRPYGIGAAALLAVAMVLMLALIANK